MTAREIASQAIKHDAMQKERELVGLLTLLKREPPHVVLEIGGMHGGTLWAWDRVMQRPGKLLCVDLFVLDGRLETVPDVDYKLVAGDSHWPGTLRTVQAILGEDKLDFLFIDGDHSLDGVTADWDMYTPLVRPGGMVAVHDTAIPHENEELHDVVTFWRSIKRAHDTLQIFDTYTPEDTRWARDSEWGGIGVVWL